MKSRTVDLKDELFGEVFELEFLFEIGQKV